MLRAHRESSISVKLSINGALVMGGGQWIQETAFLKPKHLSLKMRLPYPPGDVISIHADAFVGLEKSLTAALGSPQE